MTAGAAAHAAVMAVEGPTEVAVGAEFVLTILVSCPAGCDLSGIPIEVVAPDNTAALVPPTHPPPPTLPSPASGGGLGWGAREGRDGDGDIAAARRIALKAPDRVGEHIWRLSCTAYESSGWPHGASVLQVPVRIRPQETSLAVWGTPSPVVASRPFTIKVGAKSAAGCDLTGMSIAICDGAGAVLASGVLGDTPWPGTSSLYWTELALIAPAEAGMFSWSVEFAAVDLALPHQGSSSRFSVMIVDPPEHRLTVKVIEQQTASPVENAQVRLGAYRAATGGSGFAEFMVPKGSYDLNVWKSGYEAPTASIVVDADLAVEVAITLMPEENPDAVWQM